MRRLRLLAGGAAVGVAVTMLAWALARPELSPSATLVRAVADCAAMVSLGLALVPRLDGPRYRDELTRRAAVPLVLASSVWVLAELVRIMVSAAQAAATPVDRLSVPTLVEFGWSTTAGRSGLFSLAAAVLVCVIAVAMRPAAAVSVGIAGIAAAGMAARAVTGHLAESLVGAAGVVLHAVAAAVWCGTLAALALTVTARGQWARVLPAFSRWAVVCVAVLLVGGVVGALGAIGSPDDLVGTGYGRVLLAKIVVTAALMTLAWHNRTTWLRAAQSHRVSADVSLWRSMAELALMTSALTLAAALTLAG